TAPRGQGRPTDSRPSPDNRIERGKLEGKCHLSQPEGEPDMAEEITKQEAVRRALKAMGRAATPIQMQPYIKQNFVTDLSTDHTSASKGIILHPKKKGGKGKGAKKPAAQGAAATTGEAKEGVGRKVVVQHKPAPARSSKEEGIPLEDILHVKGLMR